MTLSVDRPTANATQTWVGGRFSHLGVLRDQQDHIAERAVTDERARIARQREVLVLIARGRSKREIAADLYVAESTVTTHVKRVLMKLDLRDRVHAVVFAYESGVLHPGEPDAD